MNKFSSTSLAALIILSASADALRAEVAPSCRQWQQQKLATESCLCGEETRRGDDRMKDCSERAGAAVSRGEAGGALPGLETRVQKAMSSAQGFDGSRFGVKSAEAEVGVSRSGQAGNGFAAGGAVTYFQSRHFSLDAGYVRHNMQEAQTSVNDAGPGLQALSVTQPNITWNSIAGFNYYPRKLGDHIRPYARVEGGFVGVPQNVNVQTILLAGGQPVQNLGSSLQPTGNGNYGAAAVGGGAELSLHKDSRFSLDVRVMHVPELGTYPTVGLKINRFGKKKRTADDSGK